MKRSIVFVKKMAKKSFGRPRLMAEAGSRRFFVTALAADSYVKKRKNANSNMLVVSVRLATSNDGSMSAFRGTVSSAFNMSAKSLTMLEQDRTTMIK